MTDHRRHIVDILIEERAPHLAALPVWPLLRPLLFRFLSYRKARDMADTIASMTGREALAYISSLLDVKVSVEGLENLPRTGRAVVIANHPTGITDGIALYDTFRQLRPDLCFYANADAHRVCPGFGDILVPVEWVDSKRTRERTRQTLLETQKAMQEERLLVIFPAGRLARKVDGQLTDPAWMASAVSVARKHGAPVIPVWMNGPWSFWFHTFDRFSAELRDITLFHELLNKSGGHYQVRVGAPVSPSLLVGEPTDVTTRLKTHVERDLSGNPAAVFCGAQTMALDKP